MRRSDLVVPSVPFPKVFLISSVVVAPAPCCVSITACPMLSILKISRNTSLFIEVRSFHAPDGFAVPVIACTNDLNFTGWDAAVELVFHPFALHTTAGEFWLDVEVADVAVWRFRASSVVVEPCPTGPRVRTVVEAAKFLMLEVPVVEAAVIVKFPRFTLAVAPVYGTKVLPRVVVDIENVPELEDVE